MMCLMAIAANAQVLTAKTISKVYADLTSCMDNSEFVYNAEQKDDVITALCVYSKADRRLKPVRRFEYTYDASGLLLRRVAYRWNELADDWLCTEAAFKFGDEGSLITAHVWAKPRPPPAAPADVPID